jgi:hypothetical protein
MRLRDHITAILVALVFVVAISLTLSLVARISDASEPAISHADIIRIASRCERLHMAAVYRVDLDGRPTAGWCAGR